MHVVEDSHVRRVAHHLCAHARVHILTYGPSNHPVIAFTLTLHVGTSSAARAAEAAAWPHTPRPMVRVVVSDDAADTFPAEERRAAMDMGRPPRLAPSPVAAERTEEASVTSEMVTWCRRRPGWAAPPSAPLSRPTVSAPPPLPFFVVVVIIIVVMIGVRQLFVIQKLEAKTHVPTRGAADGVGQHVREGAADGGEGGLILLLLRASLSCRLGPISALAIPAPAEAALEARRPRANVVRDMGLGAAAGAFLRGKRGRRGVGRGPVGRDGMLLVMVLAAGGAALPGMERGGLLEEIRLVRRREKMVRRREAPAAVDVLLHSFITLRMDVSRCAAAGAGGGGPRVTTPPSDCVGEGQEGRPINQDASHTTQRGSTKASR